MNSDDIPLAPVAGWLIGSIAEQRAVILRIDYLTHPMQVLEESHRSPTYVLTETQCAQLITALQGKLRGLENAPHEGHSGPTH